MVLVLSPGESLDSELDRRDGGVLDVVTLLRASRLETRHGGSWLLSSGARRYPRLFQGRNARHCRRVQDDAFSGPTEFRHLSLLRWCVDKESPL
jgi:hypothetical protein